MSNAVCEGCRVEVSWRAGSGARLADVRCPVCRSAGLRQRRAGDSFPAVVMVSGERVLLRLPPDARDPTAGPRREWRGIGSVRGPP